MSALHPVDLDVYRKVLKSRKLPKSLAVARLKQARKTVRRAVLTLKKQFGVKKVVLFGSMINPSLFHSRSDIDIAVWGLKGREYYRAVGVLQALDTEIGIDLIAYEDASPSLRKVIRIEGKVL
ncbi:MAG: nucleotidyltransferase domain-containing protein [Chloroflexota bacterium]